MPPEPFRLAIIGGGASAVLVLAQLMRRDDLPPMEITIYDRAGAFARGIAYATPYPEHLLNVPAHKMSAFDDAPLHFADWCRVNTVADPMIFMPRLVYGEYLESVLSDAQKTAMKKGHAVHLEPREVADPVNMPDMDAIMLATGNAEPVMLPLIGALPAGAYFPSPYQVDYSAIEKGSRILLLGTGLSMVDALLSLVRAGFEGEVTALSRRGLLPGVHVPPVAYPVFMTGATAPRTALGILRAIRQEIAAARAKNIPWQAVIDSLRGPTNVIWHALPAAEKKKARRLLPFWNIHRHRMAPEVAAASRRLSPKIIRARAQRLLASGGKVAVETSAGVFDTDHVINCLGYRAQMPVAASHILTIGPVRAGIDFETTAIPEIRQQAAGIAAEIASRAKNKVKI